METGGDPGWIGLLPIFFMAIGIGITANLLAKDKGRRVVLWTILGFTPIVNFAAIWYLIGASNLRFEQKLDELLRRLPAK